MKLPLLRLNASAVTTNVYATTNKNQIYSVNLHPIVSTLIVSKTESVASSLDLPPSQPLFPLSSLSQQARQAHGGHKRGRSRYN